MKKIISVVGARPNFMKLAPLYKALKHNAAINHLICHTGQHFDERMSKIFFDELEIPIPDYNLGVGSASHALQTAQIMIEFEKILIQNKPNLVIVFGDVNSTLACSLVASKMNVKVAHVEAGLRSFDREMPEEINRVLTDHIADTLFVSESSGLENLSKEGIDESKIHYVGNIMLDNVVNYMPRIESNNIFDGLKISSDQDYILVTFHRPRNVDTLERLGKVVDLLNYLTQYKKVVFPVHPRTSKNLDKFDLRQKLSSEIILTDPVGYIEFLALTKNADLVITDSGGIQEETTFMGVQCITVRDNTERPVTISEGTNHLAGTDFEKVQKIALELISGTRKQGSKPKFWDGNTASRIADVIIRE